MVHGLESLSCQCTVSNFQAAGLQESHDMGYRQIPLIKSYTLRSIQPSMTKDGEGWRVANLFTSCKLIIIDPFTLVSSVPKRTLVECIGTILELFILCRRLRLYHAPQVSGEWMRGTPVSPCLSPGIGFWVNPLQAFQKQTEQLDDQIILNWMILDGCLYV